jgi:Flp pilus assembly pilin Flp
MAEEAVSADDESTWTCGKGPPPVEEVARLSIEQVRSGEEGQTMTEYVVVLGVITPVILLLFTSLLDPMAERLMELVGWLT